MIHLLFMLAFAQSPRSVEPGFQTDTTLAVQQGTRLRVENPGGDITIRGWDRNQVRVQASHSARTYVEVRNSGAVLEVNARGRRGPANVVDYEITVPAWMAIDVGGMYSEISVEGTRAAIKAHTLEGDITVKGGAEQVTVNTVNGHIKVDGARGKVDLKSISESVEAANVVGDLVVETVSGDIDLRHIDSRTVDAGTVSGEVLYDGTVHDGGTYSLTTHSGEITFTVPEGANAAVSLLAGTGEYSSSFTLPATDRTTRRRRHFSLGSGSATIELETFSGDIRLVRPNEVPRPRVHSRDEGDDHDGRSHNLHIKPKVKVKVNMDQDDDSDDR